MSLSPAEQAHHFSALSSPSIPMGNQENSPSEINAFESATGLRHIDTSKTKLRGATDPREDLLPYQDDMNDQRAVKEFQAKYAPDTNPPLHSSNKLQDRMSTRYSTRGFILKAGATLGTVFLANRLRPKLGSLAENVFPKTDPYELTEPLVNLQSRLYEDDKSSPAVTETPLINEEIPRHDIPGKPFADGQKFLVESYPVLSEAATHPATTYRWSRIEHNPLSPELQTHIPLLELVNGQVMSNGQEADPVFAMKKSDESLQLYIEIDSHFPTPEEPTTTLLYEEIDLHGNRRFAYMELEPSFLKMNSADTGDTKTSAQLYVNMDYEDIIKKAAERPDSMESNLISAANTLGQTRPGAIYIVDDRLYDGTKTLTLTNEGVVIPRSTIQAIKDLPHYAKDRACLSIVARSMLNQMKNPQTSTQEERDAVSAWNSKYTEIISGSPQSERDSVKITENAWEVIAKINDALEITTESMVTENRFLDTNFMFAGILTMISKNPNAVYSLAAEDSKFNIDQKQIFLDLLSSAFSVVTTRDSSFPTIKRLFYKIENLVALGIIQYDVPSPTLATSGEVNVSSGTEMTMIASTVGPNSSFAIAAPPRSSIGENNPKNLEELIGT